MRCKTFTRKGVTSNNLDMRFRFYILAVALAATTSGAIAVHATPAQTTGRLVAKYGFDGERIVSVLDESGRGHNLTIVSSHAGALRRINHGAGQAFAFPPPCTGKVANACPRVALRSPSSADLNPGAANIAYGATLELGATQTSRGQNVVQKGYSATSSQYKLQVDGRAGHPSCVVVDDRQPGIQLVRSDVTVADGNWHTVECRRAAGSLSILVDGRVRGSTQIPVALSITNDEPLVIGGKGAYRDNDQFRGALDDVFVRIG
jgi:hypothetical protein